MLRAVSAAALLAPPVTWRKRVGYACPKPIDRSLRPIGAGVRRRCPGERHRRRHAIRYIAMRRFLTLFMLFISQPSLAPAWGASATANLSIAVTAGQAITAVSLSNKTFSGAAPSGAVVGAISVAMSPAAPPFSGSLSLTGASASRFAIAGTTLTTVGVVPAGTYNINLVATQPGIAGSPFIQSETITGTGSASSNCPRGTGYPDDGCKGAQTTGSQRVANFFTGYTGKNYGANRPPWNVAGVDYPVGYGGTPADGTLGANRPACLSFNAGSGFEATASSSDCTVSGINFEGYCVTAAVSGGHTVTFLNDYFWFSTAHCNPAGGSLLGSTGGTGNIVVRYSVFDGSQVFNSSTCSGGCPSELLLVSNAGNLTVQYNAFLRANQHDIQFNHAGTFTGEFNYIESVGLSPSHGDWIISNSGSGNQIFLEDHNTGYGGPPGATSHATAFCYLTNWDGSTAATSGTCSNDTWVSTGDTEVSYLIEINPGGIVNAVTINNNYVDWSGSFGPMALETQAGSVLNGPIVCSGNRSLVTGAPITGGISSFGAGWTCN